MESIGVRHSLSDQELNDERLEAGSDRLILEPKSPIPRLAVKGKFLFCDGQKLYIKGITYGTFCPNSQQEQFPEPEIVAHDFAQMASQGINSVRVYTVPPKWLLDLAHRHDLWIMVGLPWEQHIAFLDAPQRIADIEQRVRLGVRACSKHPALLCFAIGNEIPASMVRWYGRHRVEAFLKRLYWAVKAEDPDSLVTYVNYPSTEYLHTPFVDFYCFNVYLELQDRLDAYLARLQNLAQDKPLVMAEIGLDSQKNGEVKQAETLAWQIRSIFGSGCAGCFVFAWTDKWYRGGFEIEDWDFGLTDRSRQPKLALQTVRRAFEETPFSASIEWPKISVAVCSYNGSSTIRDTLSALQNLDYPNFETVVVDDGSTNGVAQIAQQYKGVHLIVHRQNEGLSVARNTALNAASGDIIAYIDDDAYPDPHWLTYLAAAFLQADWAGVGGPNLPPPGDGLIADCVANAPGGPVHVLVSDQEAEHIPGCNMAFRVNRLKEVGGFDPRFRSAGDDVDICWRLQNRGWKIGFSAAAVVWHHRRNCVKTYWKQQKGYGKAEALLEEKWPKKYNAVGHLSWAGRLYGKGLVRVLSFQKQRVYFGSRGSAPFQSIYQAAPDLFSSLSTMPEWYLLTLLLAGLSTLGYFWPYALWAIPLLMAASAVPVLQAIWSASHAEFTTLNRSRLNRLKLYSLTTLLYCIQPLARLWGRLDNGLTPWRRRGKTSLKWPRCQSRALWSEEWYSSEDWLSDFYQGFSRHGAIASHGGDFDPWDLEIRSGLTGSIRILMVIEEHGNGKQLVRLRSWPKIAPTAVGILIIMILLTAAAARDESIFAAFVLGCATFAGGATIAWDCSTAASTYLQSVNQLASSRNCELVQ
ncbi:glycosyltransferase [Phormidium sp. FACHB-322]|nr:glycosyltransferase [Phormidium sp. FACHB-77]MBD2030090.1 glycosyltransferase [Phormidium sp. FACHB-322]MBD2051539.1 glycosyltransferase [Leptolyngbya sp. FACHB-60]